MGNKRNKRKKGNKWNVGKINEITSFIMINGFKTKPLWIFITITLI